MLLQSPRLSGEDASTSHAAQGEVSQGQTLAIHAGLLHASTGSRTSKAYVLNPKTAQEARNFASMEVAQFTGSSKRPRAKRHGQ